MKIAYISAAEIPSIKANSIQVMKVCQALVQNGHSVQLFAPGIGDLEMSDVKQHYGIHEDFKITKIPFLKFLRKVDYSIRSMGAARKIGSELVITRILWVARLAQLWNIPVILELHELPAGRFAPWVFKQVVFSNRKCLLIFITHALKSQTVAGFGKFPDGLHTFVAPDGVDLERYEKLPGSSTARRSIGLADGLTAAYSGGFYEGRGIESVLNLAGSFPGVHFLLIGGTNQQVGFWKQRAQQAGLNNVTFTGFIPNERLPFYQAAADILLMPYAQRVAGSSGGDIASVSSPMKMFDYMASGRIILSSDLPVLREVLDETNAIFYKTGNEQDLVSCFQKVIGNIEKYKQLGNKAKEDVKQYAWRNRMVKIMEAYLSI
jgi:glycosyltransferase involved in cell wall biosynthesis